MLRKAARARAEDKMLFQVVHWPDENTSMEPVELWGFSMGPDGNTLRVDSQVDETPNSTLKVAPLGPDVALR